MTEKGEQTRVRILDTAAGLFHRQGFAATTINQILKHSGISKGNLYFHFSGKEEIGLAVLEREKSDLMQFLAEALEQDAPGDGLERFLAAALEKNQQRAFIGGCIFGNTALEASDTSPAYAAFVAEVFEDWISMLAGQIERAQRAGQARADLPAREIAEMVVATVEGAIMQSRLFKSASPLRHALDMLRKILDLRTPSRGHNA